MHGRISVRILKTNECDLLIAVGMRFDDRVTGGLDTYAKQAKVIHFDIDSVRVQQKCSVQMSSVLGDAKSTLSGS